MDQDYFHINFMKPITNAEHLLKGVDRCNIDEDDDAMLVILFTFHNGASMIIWWISFLHRWYMVFIKRDGNVKRKRDHSSPPHNTFLSNMCQLLIIAPYG